MMRNTYFDICTLDGAIKALATIPDPAAYLILRPLHCVHWGEMPRELREAVPGLIERCIGIPAHQFLLTQIPEPVSKTGSALQRLLRLA